MTTGKVVAIFVSSKAGKRMQRVEEVQALAGAGLEGDRYAEGKGSWNVKTGKGRRQVTLINAVFFKGTRFKFEDSRRNVVTEGIELMTLIGKEFMVGHVMMRGVKYCDPCDRPSKLSGKGEFREVFHDRGGLVAQVYRGGTIKVGDRVAMIQPKESPAQC